jgi:hypothetical protein
MNYKVTQSNSFYNVKIQPSPKLKVQVSAEASLVAGNLSDLNDFDPTGVQNNYLVMYDATTQKYVTVDPDVVLSTSASGNTLPDVFLDRLDIDLDNRIDLDAGTF